MVDGPGFEDRNDRTRRDAASSPGAGAPGESSPGEVARLRRELHESHAALARQNDALRRARTELDETRERYARLYDRAPAAYFTLDADGVILEANRKAATLLGREAENMAGTPFTTVVLQEEQAAFRGHIARILESGGPAALELRLLRPDGGSLHAAIVAEPRAAADASGPARVWLTATDVTRETHARQDLETVLANAPIPIVKVRVAPDGERILEYQNPAAEALFGSDAPGRSCKAYLCNKETCPALRADSGIVRDRECAVMTLSGRRVMYKTACKLPDEPAIIEAMVDVTELMRTRERLTRAMEGAEAASKAKSEFLATMSHEVRTPINGIMGMTELALQTELTPEQREYLDLARQSALSLLDIINDILDFSRIEAGRLELVREPFSLGATLDRCLRLFGQQAARRGVALSLAIAPDVPDALRGDSGRLLQIVGNLVSNGIKFSKDGEVRVRVETAPPLQCPLERSEIPSACLLFAVSDDGVGIPADKHARIFDAFTQLDGSLTRGAGGTGLGLSICKSLVTLMGGRLWVESAPNAGSTFFFTVMLEQAIRPVEPASAPAVQETDGPAMDILLVEDNAINQLVAKRLLERRGHAVTAVDSGQAALEMLRKTSYDCVLMDVEMPGLNGLETLGMLRDTSVFGPAAAVPVVALTAHAVKGYRERILAAGFDDYVAKPIDMRELTAALARAAAQGPAATGDGPKPPDAT